ncbi:MAG: GNAT family N-acetyltransferase [Burkholderiaceae bacterium]|nr:GNAT family N-acetyltransferase [Burkholderiaceae bacterium]
MAAMSRTLIETGLGWRYTPPRMAALIDDPDTVALVACDIERLRGLAVMHFGEARAHLVLLCVDPARQRHGIGRRLVDWLLSSARVAGIGSVGLELRADNPAALAFYRRLGFVETRWLPGYYDGRIAARCMQRVLGPEPALR